MPIRISQQDQEVQAVGQRAVEPLDEDHEVVDHEVVDHEVVEEDLSHQQYQR